MSIKVSERVWQHSRHKGSALLLLLAIARHANNEDGSGAWPSVGRLAKLLRLQPGRNGERHIRRLLKTLAASGELSIEERRGRSSRYWVRVGDDSQDRGDAEVIPQDGTKDLEGGAKATDAGVHDGMAAASGGDDAQVRGDWPTGQGETYLSVPDSSAESFPLEEAAPGAAFLAIARGRRGTGVRGSSEGGRGARERTPAQEAEHAAALARVRGA